MNDDGDLAYRAYGPPLSYHSILAYLELDMPGWRFEPAVDEPFVKELLDDFPRLDLLSEIKLYRWHYRNRPPSSRATLRRWIARAKPSR